MHRKTKTERIDNTLFFFILSAPFSILFYASYVFNPANRGNTFLYILQILADTITIVSVGTLWLTILLDIIQSENQKRSLSYHKDWIKKYPLTVDVFVPVMREPMEIISKTLEKAVQMDYPHSTYVLDDGNSPEIEKLAYKQGIQYLSRPRHDKFFAKAGNLNYGIKRTASDFIAIFDADHMPRKEFLNDLLPFFENEKVALVQSPQHYVNVDHFISRGTAEAQDIFYKYIQPAKNSYNASFCVGTNMIYRRKAIESIGGIALLDHSEDIWTTILLHEAGWESIFFNKVLASGRSPETIKSFFRQQNRWARGGFSLFFLHNPLFSSKLTKDQKLQYFFSNIHYFTGFSILVYLTLPVIYLLTGEYSMDPMKSSEWLIHYIPYFATVYFLPFFLSGKFSVATISTALSSFAPYLQAFFSVIVKTKYTWIATEAKQKTYHVFMSDVWPHVLLILLSMLGIFVGWYLVTDIATTLFTTIWTLFNSYMLFAFVKNGLQEEL